MRIDGVASAFQHRVRHPGRVGLLFLVAGAWALVRLAIHMPYGRFGMGEAFIPLGLMLGGLLVAPMPWQWTGNETPLAPLGRGLIQSLIWNGLWLLLFILALGALGDADRVDRPPPRPGPAEPRPAPPPWRELGPRPPRGEAREGPPRPPFTPPASPELQLFSLGLMLSTVLGRVLAEREAVEARERVLQAKSNETRALALQAQMQPHALFNALSGLVELVREDPQATEEALVALCDYLRRLMAHSRSPGGQLRAERELLEDYLRIEQIRLGDRLKIRWSWPGWADELRMPPLLLQPLVENAILHGIAPLTDGGEVRIAVIQQEGALLLEVANTGGAPTGQRNGTGLGHLRERLALWNPRISFELNQNGGWTRARILVPEPLPPC